MEIKFIGIRMMNLQTSYKLRLITDPTLKKGKFPCFHLIFMKVISQLHPQGTYSDLASRFTWTQE